MKKTVKRRSNWYIYLITFIISAALLGFAVWNMRDVLFPGNIVPPTSSSGRVDYRPDASYNMTLLLMLSEDIGGVPQYFMLANYRPRDEVLVLVPLKSSLYCTVGNESGGLGDIYKSGGVDGVLLAVNNTVGVLADHYIKFDKEAFIGFIDLVGVAPVNIPYELVDGDTVFHAGSAELDGARLYEYLTFPDWGEGEDYRSVVHGSAISGFINRNSQNRTVAELQSYFNKILNTATTDLDLSVFTSNQSAYLYTTENSYNIAEYYVPYGEVNGDGYFMLAENSAKVIRERFGKTE